MCMGKQWVDGGRVAWIGRKACASVHSCVRALGHDADSGDHSVVCSLGYAVGGRSVIIYVLFDAWDTPRTTKVGWSGA